MMAAERIIGLARRRRLQRRMARAIFAIGLGAFACVAALKTGIGTAAASAIGLGAGLLCAIAARRFLRNITNIEVARHLDRVVPAAEESSELVLRQESGLTLLERLQRERTRRALESAHLPAVRDARSARVTIGGAAAFVAALALAFFPIRTAEPAREPLHPGAVGAVGTRGRLVLSEVDIRAPRYTGRPVRTQDSLDIDAEEGAVIRWTFRATGTVTAPRLATSTGDTIPLTRAEGERLTATATARRSLLYQVLLDSAATTPEIHRLTVRPDAPPEITVLRPAPRSELPPGASLRIPVEVLATDDYGTASAELVATVTTGSGESVRFREQRIPLPPPGAAHRGALFRTTLDLAALGMAPGDELYFHVLARDRRPEPNTGRSATVFVSLADTAAASPALVAGVALPTAPEFFRSQRQIIIDTERLVADAPRLPVEIFRERANAIGMDQGLLRLRYGEFTGEEFEEEVEAGETHEHDSEENATLLADSVKATLTGAIAQMWEAELRLRTYRPAEALPYEYRALELLKAVQQSSRAYVQRVGFEPPPLEIDRRRLTGKLDGIRSRSVRDSVTAGDPRRATREALILLQSPAAPSHASGEGDVRLADRAALAAAEDELARLAVDGDRALLEALRRMRRLRASLRAGEACAGCVASAESALMASLPPAAPDAPARSASGPLARRYVELLEGEE